MSKIPLLILLSLSNNKPYLVLIEKPVKSEIQYLTQTEKYFITVLSEEELSRFKNEKIKIIEEYSEEKEYFIIKKRTSEADIIPENILYKNENFYIIKGIPEKINTKYFFIKRIPKNLKRFIPEKIKNDFPEYNKIKKYNQIISDIVSMVSPDSVLNFVRTLQNFVTRNSYTQGCLNATNWAKNYMLNHGIDSVYFDYHTSGMAPNVIGIKYGLVDSYYVVSGHIDATIGSPWWEENIAPGADDDGSGSSGVLECVRVMGNYNFKYTIYFILFTGEEQGLYGSESFCQSRQNDPIIGDIQLDMIGYVDFLPESLDLISNQTSKWLMDSFEVYTQNYVPELKLIKIVDASFWYSDHSSFWDIGKSAILGIEDKNVPNPYYHSEADTIGAGFNNINFCTNTIKATAATIAGLAKPVVGIGEKKYRSSELSFLVRGNKLIFKKPASGEIYRISGRKILAFKKKQLIKLKRGIWFINLENKSLKTKIIVLK